MNSNSTTDSAQARAARWVPEHPQELCRSFVPQPIPARFWCANCGWNQPMHDDEDLRQAIAAELAGTAK